MPKSTANFIAYDMRPAKQTERRGIVEYLNCARSVGFPLSEYRYLGFGGTKFIDFQLMHKHVGFSSYQSVEQDHDLRARCVFNKPFQALNVYSGPFSDFIAADVFPGNTVFWLDYEMCIGGELLEDLNAAALRAKDGDFFFVSISGELPPRFERSNDRIGILRSRMPSLRDSINRLKPMQLTAQAFPETAGKLLLLMLKSSFAVRLVDGVFAPSFKVIYKDSTWMVTVGGVFVRNRSRRLSKLNASLRQSLSAMCPEKRDTFYRVPNFNFTQLERILLDKSDVSQRAGYIRRLISLGLSEELLQEYERIARFVPKFSEIAF